MAEHMPGGRQRLHGAGCDAERRQCLLCLYGAARALQQHGLPQPRQKPLLRALLQQDAPVFHIQHQRHGPMLRSFCSGRRLYGQCLLHAQGAGRTQPAQGTLAAQGRAARQAHQCPQLHQRLVVVAGAFRRLQLHHASCQVFFYVRPGHIAPIVQDTGEHPQYVAVHGGHGQTKADGGDGARRICAYARQLQQRVIIGGQRAPVLLHYDLRGLLQIPHTAVIAQALP